MVLEELFGYKNELMKTLCNNKRIVELVTKDPSIKTPAHSLAYENFFPFEYIPDTVEESKTYICFDVDSVEVENKTYLYSVIYVWIYTHRSNLRLAEGGLRLDELAIEINKELNGSRYYGLGELYFRNTERFVPITDWYGRCLTFRAKDFNMMPGSKPAPAVRRFR